VTECAYNLKRQNLAVKFMWLIRQLHLRPFPNDIEAIFTWQGRRSFVDFLSGKYTQRVIFCFLFCFVCFIIYPISFFIIKLYHQVYRMFLVDPANRQQKQMLGRTGWAGFWNSGYDKPWSFPTRHLDIIRGEVEGFLVDKRKIGHQTPVWD